MSGVGCVMGVVDKLFRLGYLVVSEVKGDIMYFRFWHGRRMVEEFWYCLIFVFVSF